MQALNVRNLLDVCAATFEHSRFFRWTAIPNHALHDSTRFDTRDYDDDPHQLGHTQIGDVQDGGKFKRIIRLVAKTPTAAEGPTQSRLFSFRNGLTRHKQSRPPLRMLHILHMLTYADGPTFLFSSTVRTPLHGTVGGRGR